MHPEHAEIQTSVQLLNPKSIQLYPAPTDHTRGGDQQKVRRQGLCVCVCVCCVCVCVCVWCHGVDACLKAFMSFGKTSHEGNVTSSPRTNKQNTPGVLKSSTTWSETNEVTYP
jgi:hypothetical protein